MTASPLAHNPLRTPADLQDAVRAMVAPLTPYVSPGGARVVLGATGASFDDVAAAFEGFARPLWGLAPLAAGGGAFVDWQRFRRGLESGSDPDHAEYWGAVGDRDQRMVEMAALGFGLALAPQELWTPLATPARKRLTRWLLSINDHALPDNNWWFFRVLVNLGLARVGAEHDAAAMQAALDRLETFDLGDGWYSDGPTPQRDYYVAFAMHYYGLVYAQLAGDVDPARAGRFRERAGRFAQDFIYWFDADGGALPFGRSLTYRFAQCAFWGALAYADVDAVPWGVVKGLVLRHLRWWARRPIFASDGTLSIGYGYPNLNMAEQYNSPGSPYWALKAFLPLALAPAHPFWRSEETPLPELDSTRLLPHAGQIVCRHGSHVFALASGQQALWARHGAAKYGKFAYSNVFAFSVPGGDLRLEQAAADNMLALSDDGAHYRVRESIEGSRVDSDALWSLWRPWPDVDIETWLVPALPWHVRVHRVRSARLLWSAEGGFSVDRSGPGRILSTAPPSDELALALADFSAGLSGLRAYDRGRWGAVVATFPNTNLVAPRTVLPLLYGQHAPGDYVLACAVLATPDREIGRTVWGEPPRLPLWVPGVPAPDSP